VSSYHGDQEQQGAALRAMRGRVDGLLVLRPMPRARFPDRQPAAVVADGVDQHLSARAGPPGAEHRRPCRCDGDDPPPAGRRPPPHCLHFWPDLNFDARERLRGFRDALAAFGSGAEGIELPGDFDEASGHRAGQELLAAGALPDAVFAANDMMALGCLYAFTQAGVRVPADVALAGFDDIPLARFVHPSLTTMQVSIAELGDRAMTRLLQLMDGTSTDGTGTSRPWFPA
jgi:LacI family transcriptional regulator